MNKEKKEIDEMVKEFYRLEKEIAELEELLTHTNSRETYKAAEYELNKNYDAYSIIYKKLLKKGLIK